MLLKAYATSLSESTQDTGAAAAPAQPEPKASVSVQVTGMRLAEDLAIAAVPPIHNAKMEICETSFQQQKQVSIKTSRRNV
jgi:hypothetical protein